MTKQIAKMYLVIVFLFLGVLLYIGFTFHTHSYSATEEQEVVIWEKFKEVSSENAVVKKLESTLPSEKLDGSSIGFFTVHQNIEVYIGSELRYILHKGDNSFGKSPGIAWNFIQLQKKDESKKIEIRITSPYKECLEVIPVFYLGSTVSVYLNIIEENMFSFSLCVITFLIGLFTSFYWMYVRRRVKMDMGLFFLGVFVMLYSLWSINETAIMTLLFRNQAVSSYFSYFLLMAMPIPIILFVKELFFQKDHPIWYVLCGISILDMLDCTCMQLLNIMDFRESLFLTHILYVIIIVVIMWFIKQEIKKDGLTKHLKLYIVCIAIGSFFILIDLVMFYFSVGDSNRFGRIGFFTYIVIVGISAAKSNAELMKRGKEAEIYHKLAFTDQLTGIYNRHAYVQVLAQETSHMKHAAITMLDLNDLKKCNDMFGHGAGDRYIIASALIIQESFEGIGETYRIGGDEFCVLAIDSTKEKLEQAFNKLDEKIEYYNSRSKDIILKIARGCAEFNQELDRNLEDTRDRADAIMYQNKQKMKQ